MQCAYYKYESPKVYHIEYLFVWVTKCRSKVLASEAAVRVCELGRQMCECFEISIVRAVVNGNHVHIVVSATREMARSKIVRRINGRTASWLLEGFPHMKKRYWGRHVWPLGCFCAAVGQMTEEMINRYQEQHFEPNPNNSINMEPECRGVV